MNNGGDDVDSQCDRGRRLDGWKAIAGYFGRDIRTVQRWERNEGLPVGRHGHDRQASVYADVNELDAASNSGVAGAVVLVVGLGGLAWVLMRR